MNEIIFPFIIQTNDHHEFECMKKLLIALDIDCKRQKLDGYLYSAVFYVDGKFPINLKDESGNDVRVLEL